MQDQNSVPTQSDTPTPEVTTSPATSTLLSHIQAAGKAELEALKPQIAVIVRQFVAKYEAEHMTGLIGRIERHILDAVVDSAFGPPPTT